MRETRAYCGVSWYCELVVATRYIQCGKILEYGFKSIEDEYRKADTNVSCKWARFYWTPLQPLFVVNKGADKMWKATGWREGEEGYWTSTGKLEHSDFAALSFVFPKDQCNVLEEQKRIGYGGGSDELHMMETHVEPPQQRDRVGIQRLPGGLGGNKVTNQNEQGRGEGRTGCGQGSFVEQCEIVG